MRPNKESVWQSFTASGKIEDYLNYRGVMPNYPLSYTSKGASAPNAPEYQWNDIEYPKDRR